MPRRPSFTIEQMRSFLAVAEQEHVSRAAVGLHLTQGAVTQQIHNFERALGVRLLERTGRGVRLTDAGRALAASCRGALRAIELVAESADAIRTLESGSLHVGASPTCATYYLPPLLGEFMRLHPGVELGVTVATSDEINSGVRAGALDCALIEGKHAEDLTNFPVGTDELVLVASAGHVLAQAGHITGDMLGRERYLGRGPSWSAETTARQMIGDAYEVSPALNLGHTDYIRAAAVAGLGYAALPLEAVEGELATGTLKRLPWPSRKRVIRAVRREHEGGPMLEAFWQFVTATRALRSG